MHIFILNLDVPFRNEDNFIISLLFKSLDFGFRSRKGFFLQFLVDILPLGFGSVEPHIFAALDPGSQNLADPTAPDPKHWKGQTTNFIFDIFICRNCLCSCFKVRRLV